MAVYARRDGYTYAANAFTRYPWRGATVLRVLDTAPEPPAARAGIDPDSITEWTWCLVRDGGGGGEQVVQVKGGRYRGRTTGGDFPDDWTIVTDKVRFGGERA